MKHFKLFFACLLMTFLSIGQMWATDATMTAGTNGSACTVNSKDGIKVGTSKAGGSMSITVGAGATKLTFYAAAWKGVTDLSLNVTGITADAIALTADAGITNNSPFTLSGTESNFKKEITLSNITQETTITFTSSTTKRFVVWGATYETSSGDDPGDEPVSVESVALNKDALSLEIGATEKLTATITPSNATNKNVTWASSNNDVATVDETGVVTAVASGNANITVTTADGSFQDVCAVTITVPEGDIINIGDVTFSGSSSYCDWTVEKTAASYKGNSNYSNAYIQLRNQSSAGIVSTTSGGSIKKVKVKWANSVASPARTITIYGKNTAYEGPADLYDNNKCGTALGTITQSAVGTTDVFEYDGSQGDFAYVGVKANGALYFTPITFVWESVPTHEFTYSIKSGDESKGSVEASVSSGSQVAEGATVTLTPEANDYYQVASVSVNAGAVTVTEAAGVYSFTMPKADAAAVVSFEYIPVTSVEIDATLELVEGEGKTLSATVNPITALGTVTWVSDDPDVATVDENGYVLAVAEGTANITAISTVTNSVSGLCAVTVSAPTGNPITISQNTGGTVAANVDVADVLKDVSVTLTATPAAGYSVSGWTIVGVDASDLTISEDKTTCTFAMPESEVLAEASFTHETATLKLVELGVENAFDSENTHYWKESVTLPSLAGLGCSGKVFVGWDADANCAIAPAYVAGDSYEIPNKGENKLYAVFATESAGSSSWDEITAVPTAAGEYAICTGTYFMKASVASNRFENGSATPSIENGSLAEEPASDCIWELSINADGKFLFKNGTKYAAGNGTKNQGALNTSATDTKSQWTITYNNGFVITNVYNSSQNVNAVLRQNGTYGWAAYGATQNGAAGAPRLFKKTIGEASYSDYTTSCSAALPKLDAPVFGGIVEGVYYEAQNNITLSAADGATIYFVINQPEITEQNRIEYTQGAISLSEYGSYTVKAIAVKDGYEASDAVEATYIIGKEFASVSALYTYLQANSLTELNNVKVTGVVSRITYAWDPTKGNMTYYISDDGQTTNDLQMFKGAGLEADEVAVGDQVTVTGNYIYYQGTTHEIGAGNTIVARTAGAHDSYEIVGELTQTNFVAGATFNDGYMVNLKVNDVYNTGYKVEVSEVSFSADKTTLAVSDKTIHITATKNDATLVEKDFAISVSAATLESFVLKEGYKTEYYVSEAFVKPTVIATLSDDSQVEAEATTCTGYVMNAAGEYTVNVAFTYGEITIDEGVEYQITVKAIFNNEDAPHTVAVANALIVASAYQDKTSSTDYMWVRGKVVGFNGTSNNNYYISDDGTAAGQLYVYNGKYFNGATMNATNKPAIGDEVILKATILNYQGNTAELTNSWVVYQLREPEFAIADVVAADEFEANVSEDMAVVPTVNSGNAEFTLASNNEEAVTIENGKLHAVAEGDAVITASRAATNNANALNYKAKEITFNVHVIAERTRYTVTFDANGGEGTDPEAIANQLAGATVDMPTSTPLYNKEGHAFTGWKVINLSTEAEIEVVNDQFEMPAANVKIQAQWAVVATCAISFQVGGQEVATANAPQEADYNISQVGAEIPGFTFLGWSETEYADEVETAPTLIDVYHAQADEESKVLYGIYSREEDYGNQHYVLDYLADGVGDQITAAYGNAVNITATDGGQWVVKAYKNAGMQINTGKNGSIKVPSCSGDIVSIGITCSIAKSVGFSASDYSGSGTITYVVSGTDATSQTLDFAGKEVKDGYIVPKGGSTAITRIDVEYSTAKTVYTSSPKEKVTVTFALAGGQGGCQTTTIDKGGELTICDIVPTKAHSEFLGWKKGDDVYVAGQAYTFDADITLTAQWDEAGAHAVTYDVNGSEDAAPTMEPQYAGDQFAIAAGVTKEGYTFKGWLYNNKLYKAGTQFLMPNEDVEFVANWKKSNISTDKMMLISDESGLANGMTVALGCSYGESNFAMAGGISGGYMASVSGANITLNNGLATFTDAVVTMIAEQVEDGWTLRKDDTNYLTITNKDVKWDIQANATVWTISFNEGNVEIANGSNKIRFNSSSPRFKTYTSAQTPIQLFGKATVVTETANVSDLGYEGDEINIVASGDITLTIDVQTTAQSITATNGATVVIGAPTTAQSVNVEEGSKIVAEAATETPIVNFSTTLGSSTVPSTGSALGNADNITLAAGGEIHYDITLGTSMAGVQADPNQWHAFTVPFPVEVSSGIYNAETGAKLTNGVDYAIMDYHGDIRANGQYGWKKYHGTLVPGTFYIMTVNGDVKTFRFKISTAAEMVLPALNSMDYTAYGVTDPENTTSDQGWNGIGNPSWVSVTVNYPVQVLDPYGYEYQTLPAGTVISASTPFFYKANANSTMTMTESNANAQYAPKRTPANEIKNMAVRFGNEVFADKLYVTASEDALNSYEQDKDLVKMTMTNTPKVAQIFGNAYGMKLSMVNTPLINDNAEVALELYAPAAGEYTISIPETEGYQVYLMREGNIIWNLSMGEYTAAFEKGTNTGYSIRIAKAPAVVTGLENGGLLNDKNGVQKVLLNGQMYILRGQKLYDATGKMIK